MHKLTNKILIKDIKYLKSLEQTKDVKDEINILLEKIYSPISFNDRKKYDKIKHYKDVLDIIINKYDNKSIKNIEYDKFIISNKDLLEFSLNLLNNINSKWYKELICILNNKTYFMFNKSKDYFGTTYYSKHLNKYYIEINKFNCISDLFTPIHEFMHVYWSYKNINTFYSLESEFLSSLIEMITNYELNKNLFFDKEIIKPQLDTLDMIYGFINSLKIRFEILNNNLVSKDNIYNYLNKKYLINKDSMYDLFSSTLDELVCVIISYFIAIELFYIYLDDKDYCFHICDNLIRSNESFRDNLDKYNINLTKNSDNYIKYLKKTINNQ